jgi:hypothetical protein
VLRVSFPVLVALQDMMALLVPQQQLPSTAAGE